MEIAQSNRSDTIGHQTVYGHIYNNISVKNVYWL